MDSSPFSHNLTFSTSHQTLHVSQYGHPMHHHGFGIRDLRTSQVCHPGRPCTRTCHVILGKTSTLRPIPQNLTPEREPVSEWPTAGLEHGSKKRLVTDVSG